MNTQNDGFNCGFYACHYAKQLLITGSVFDDPAFDIRQFRSEVFDQLRVMVDIYEADVSGLPFGMISYRFFAYCFFSYSQR